MKRLSLCGLLILAAAAARADGTTAVPFLTLPSGARASAMGGAFTAAATDATAVHWNPASLTSIKRRSASFTHATYIDGSSFDDLSLAQNGLFGGALGLGVRRLSFGDLDTLDSSGNKSGTFAPSDMSIALAYARAAGGVRLGASVKYIQSKVVDSASAQALDAGVLVPGLAGGKVDLGAAFTNLGPGIKYGDKAEDLPTAFRAGALLRAGPSLALTGDVVSPRGGNAFAAVGLEYGSALGKSVGWNLRAGFTSEQSDVEGAAGFSAGFGLEFSALKVDYGFVPAGDLGTTHRVSLGYDF